MANTYEVPTRPNRPFSIRTTIDGFLYTLHFRYNNSSRCWILDIANYSNQVLIVAGIPLITGTDLLGQFGYMPLGVHTVMTVMTLLAGVPADTVPTFFNLGVDAHLYITNP
jgi:hypothetical protein